MESAAPTRPARASAAQPPYLDALLHIAGLSIVAGGIHAIVVPQHLAETPLYGVLFATLAAFQIGWGPVVYSRPSARAFRAGAAVSIAVIGVWIASRTIGTPLGPEPWAAEPIGPLDLAATACEALIAGLCGAFLAGGRDASVPGALAARFRLLAPLAMATMGGGLLAMILGGHHVH
jgi:hypothetical protein